jgi:hypothetical protein
MKLLFSFFSLLLLCLTLPVLAADKPMGVIGDGVADDTTALQAALDAQGKTGGEVILPPGQYRLGVSLRVPTGVTLKGSWDAPHHGAWDKGTTLAITGGRGREEGPAAIELAESSSVQGITMVWPEQKWDTITAYPWAIHGQGMHNDVENITFINAYQGIKIGIPWSELHLIRNVSGCVLRRGIFIDTTSDIGRIENVQFNEHYWARSHYPGITTGSDAPVTKYTEANLEAFIFGRTDWEYVLNTFVFGARIGYRFIHTPAGECNGQFLGIGADGCHVGVQIDAIQSIGLQVTNGEFTTFTGEPNAGVVTSPGAGGAAQFVNCNFWSNPGGVAQMDGGTAVTFSDCHFSDTPAGGAIVARKGRLIVHGCNFSTAGTAIVLKLGVPAAVITENLQPGGIQVQNEIGARAQIGLNELPFALPDASAVHYRVKIGAAGDEDYVGSGWYGGEGAADVPNSLKPAVQTARWAGGTAKLHLPVVSGRAYTLKIWTISVLGAPARTFQVDGGPKTAVTTPHLQIVTLAIPASLTRGRHSVGVTISGPTWTPTHLQPPATDSRALTTRVFALEMTAAGTGTGTASGKGTAMDVN